MVSKDFDSIFCTGGGSGHHGRGGGRGMSAPPRGGGYGRPVSGRGNGNTFGDQPPPLENNNR